jgi:hypothetical protein
MGSQRHTPSTVFLHLHIHSSSSTTTAVDNINYPFETLNQVTTAILTRLYLIEHPLSTSLAETLPPLAPSSRSLVFEEPSIDTRRPSQSRKRSFTSVFAYLTTISSTPGALALWLSLICQSYLCDAPPQLDTI